MPVKINGTGYIGTANNIFTDASGQVGIGTASPGVSLDITNDANTLGQGLLRLNSAGNYGTRMTFSSTYTNGRNWQIGSNFVDGVGEFAVYDATAGAKRLNISSAGYVNIPYQPRFSGYRTAGTVASGNVYIANVADINVGSCYNTSTGIFTAPIAGDYFIGVFGLSNDSSSAAFQIFKNSSLVTGFWPYQSSNVGNGANPCGFGLVSLAANDTLKINVAAGNIIGDTNYHNRTTIYLIG